MTCINCGSTVETKFCGACGQPNPPKKISLGHMWYDFQSRIYGFDGMFPRTLRDLTLRPGVAAESYLRGNRVLYYGPVGYFFLMATLLVLLADIFSVDLVEFMKAGGNAFSKPKAGSGQDKVSTLVITAVVNNMKLFFFFVIPIQAAVSKYLFFRKSGHNYFEHAVLPFYIQGHIIWVSIALMFCYLIFGEQSRLPFTVMMLSIFYFGYSYMTWITYQPKVKVFFKGLGVYLVAQLLFLLLFFGVFLLAITLNEDLYQMMKPSNNP